MKTKPIENNSVKKILMLGNSHLVIFRFRKELIEKLVSEGYEVWVSFPNGPFGEGNESSKKFGCKFIEMNINRRGKNPLQDLVLLFKYFGLIKKLKPDMVLAYTVKPDIYGGIASRICKVPFIPNITGLGKGLEEKGIFQKVLILLYQIAVKRSECIFFQNERDKKFFDDHTIKYNKGIILPGSGVNLEEFKPLPYPKNDVVRFTYIARVMKAKGIEQFLEAARYIKLKYPNTEFHVCGYCEEDYTEIIEEYEREKIIFYHGLVENIIDYVDKSNCIILPTFHPEGISNVLLEAAACARPIITTDRHGCRETINDGLSGYLVRERDSKDLIDKIEQFLKLSYEEKKHMGLEGRKKIEEEFDRRVVVESYINEIEKKVK